MKRESPTARMGPVSLCLLGGTLGLIHVLTGPDHISAIVTLSVGGSYKAFWLGTRWGVGHSIGLLIMFLVFMHMGKGILGEGSIVNYIADLFVGMFMVVLGLVGIFRAYRNENGAVTPNEIPPLDVSAKELELVSESNCEKGEISKENLQTRQPQEYFESSTDADAESEEFKRFGQFEKVSLPLGEAVNNLHPPQMLWFELVVRIVPKDSTDQQRYGAKDPIGAGDALRCLTSD
eukprot:767265-Hanusia_phi.AAC.3